MIQRNISRKIFLVSTIGTSIMSGVGYAQNPSEGTNPAIVERQFEPEQLPESKPELQVKIAQPEQAPKNAEAIHFHLRHVTFTGNTVISGSRLHALAAPLIGQKVSVSQLYKLAEDITRLYREEGYLLSRAILPPQEITKHGKAKIQIVEGYVASVRFEGDTDAVTPLIRSYAAKIKKSHPLKDHDLERYLLLIRDIPGREVESVLKPSKTQLHASDLVLVIKKKFAQGFIDLNNEGSRSIGPGMGFAGASLNSLLDRSDQVTVQGATTQRTSELKYGHASYSQYLGSEGTKIAIDGTAMRTHAGGDFRDLNMRGHLKSAGLALSHPFIRSRAQTLSLGSRISAKNSRSSLGPDGALRTSDDKLRILAVNLSYDVADSWRGANLFLAELSHGFTGMGAMKKNDPRKSRAYGHVDFTKFTLDASRLQGLWGGFSLYALVNWQQAFNPLLTPERFSYGGAPQFKAYTNQPLTGDTGVKEKVELRYGNDRNNAPNLPSFLHSYQVYGFGGYGTIWNKKPLTDEHKRISAGMYGGGLRLTLFEKTHLSVEYTTPQRKQINQLRNREGWYVNLMQQF